MKSSITALLVVSATVLTASAGASGRVRPARAGSTQITPEPVACAIAPASVQTCVDGALGDAAAQPFTALHADDVRDIIIAAAASLDANTMTIAVVDRTGRPLALYRKPGANPANDDLAVGVARTAAFFSHDMAPLSSRTVRFISGIHFPPGVTNASNAALYGIENTNRGCDFNVTFNPGQCLPRARSTNGLPCSSADRSGCGPGIVTGKQQPDDGDPSAVNAGGIPLYRILGTSRVTDGAISDGKVIGAIGVVGVADPEHAEFAAVSGAFGALGSARGPIAPVPAFPLPFPGNVFIDGIRLPFLGNSQKLTFNSDRLPTGIARPSGTRAGTANGSFTIAPGHGGCAPSGYLAGPKAGLHLTQSDVDGLVQRAISTAKRTRGVIRLPLNSYARMVIAVGDVDGSILALYRMPDATVFSIDVAVAKARNVVYFSGANPDLPGVPAGTAVSNRTLGFTAQPLFPPGISSNVFDPREGPFFPSLFVRDLANPCTQGSQPVNPNQNGIVFFPGASPLYRSGALAGGLGISGDGVEQDDYVTLGAAEDFAPDDERWADRILIDSVRLPMFKFPRHPEGVTECGGGPCD
jgi:uncharacterized protein GlcG (DUF336 family)